MIVIYHVEPRLECIQGAPYVFEQFSEAVLMSWVAAEIKCYHIFQTQHFLPALHLFRSLEYTLSFFTQYRHVYFGF